MTTREELILKINDDITSRDSSNKSSAPLVGGVAEAIMDYVQPYKKIVYDMEITGTDAITATLVHDDFPDLTKDVTFTSSNNNIQITGLDSQFSSTDGKVKLVALLCQNSSQIPVIGFLNENFLPTIRIRLLRQDGSSAGLPNLKIRKLEIQLWP